LARSWEHHTLPEGPALCPTALSALGHIHSPKTGVCCTRYVADMTPREGAGQLPALLLDQGQPPAHPQVVTRRRSGAARKADPL
jgi:hypothetical protein